MKPFPAALRSSFALPLSFLPARFWDRIGTALLADPAPYLGVKARKALRTIAHARDLEGVFGGLVDEWAETGSPVVGATSAETQDLDLSLGERAPDIARMMYCDAVTYLPDDILCKVDRASMAVSLEVHCPFLDHRVAEFAARIPLRMKVRNGVGKQILRQMLYREAPRNLFERPKSGFGVPVGDWVKGPLKDWAEALLDARRIRSEGWFDPKKIERRWREHLGGERDSSGAIWAILMFQAWLDEQSSAPSIAA
jgi:asparagine synthase (glutamine-hydrolysing)